MKSRLFSIVLGMILLTLSSCSNKSEATVEDSSRVESISPKASQSDKNTHYTCEECVALIEKIVRSSDYDTYFKKNYKMGYSVLINEATKEKVTIQIVIENDVPMGWLELKINDETPKDISNDPEEPKDIRGDIQMIRDFKEKCLQCCLD
jgi:hypothetical protein